MEILLLIGIFIFAVAAVLRSSEALTRTEHTEKELHKHEILAEESLASVYQQEKESSQVVPQDAQTLFSEEEKHQEGQVSHVLRP